MRATMILQVPSLCCSAHVRYIPVSLPRIDCLIADQPGKYALPALPGTDVQPDAPARRGARWTSHDRGGYRRRREQRDLAELARLLGEPAQPIIERNSRPALTA